MDNELKEKIREILPKLKEWAYRDNDNEMYDEMWFEFLENFFNDLENEVAK